MNSFPWPKVQATSQVLFSAQLLAEEGGNGERHPISFCNPGCWNDALKLWLGYAPFRECLVQICPRIETNCPHLHPESQDSRGVKTFATQIPWVQCTVQSVQALKLWGYLVEWRIQNLCAISSLWPWISFWAHLWLWYKEKYCKDWNLFLVPTCFLISWQIPAYCPHFCSVSHHISWS